MKRYLKTLALMVSAALVCLACSKEPETYKPGGRVKARRRRHGEAIHRQAGLLKADSVQPPEGDTD